MIEGDGSSQELIESDCCHCMHDLGRVQDISHVFKRN